MNSKALRANARGFTLIELMMVVGIIGLLAALAIPNFIRYQLRSKQGEAKANIGGIRISQESFRAEYDAYVNVQGPNPDATPTDEKRAWDITRSCPNNCSRTRIGQCNQFACMGFQPSGDVYFVYDTNTQNRPADYAVGARSNLDGDATPGHWFYGTNNNNMNAQPRPNNAGFGACRGVTAGELKNCTPESF